MAIYLTNDDLRPLISFADAIELVEDAFEAMARGDAVNRPRQRVRAGKAGLNVLVASAGAGAALGFKAYSSGPKSPGHLNFLYSAEDARLLAVLQAGWLGLIRTSAASAVATRALARPDAKIAAFLGAGRQARGQLEAVCQVRPFQEVRCFSPSGSSAVELADLARGLGYNAVVTPSAQQATEGADVITVATNGTSIALEGRWLKAGAHVNAMGVNRGVDREIDAEAVTRAQVIAVDEKDNARVECGDLLPVVESGELSWERVYDLGQILIGAVPGRQAPEAITLFESQGLGLEDMAVSVEAYQRALKAGLGSKLPF